MSDTLRDALAPCPFCGGAAECFPDDVGSGGQHVGPYHAGCCRPCRMFFTEEEPEDAIAAWNRRAALAAAEQPAAPAIMPINERERMLQSKTNRLIDVALDLRDFIEAIPLPDRAPPGPAQPGAAPTREQIDEAFSRGTDAWIRATGARQKHEFIIDEITQLIGATPLPAVPQPAHPDILDDLTLDDCLSFLAIGWKKVHGRTERQMVMQILALLSATPQPDASAGAQRETDSERVLRLMASGWLVAHNESWSALTDEANTATAWFCERTAAPFCTSRYESVRRWTGPTPIAALDASIADLGAEFPKIAKAAAPTPATPGETT
ncbi:MAG: Lar family restriction alleviation protein [Pseudomonadota bacterium]